MKIKNLVVKNKALNFTNINLDFSNNGLYLIRGVTGCGKTSIIKEILFGKNTKIEFDNENDESLFIKKRYKLISYFAQNILDNQMRIYDYICKGSKVKKERLFELLEFFEFESDILNKKYYRLSGGEKMKISLISVLLKNTKYIFLDEPTNNLDNKSINKLISILNQIKNTSKIIIVSHDIRLQNLECSAKYLVENNEVKVVEKSNSIVFEQQIKKDLPNTSFLKLGFSITKNLSLFFSVIATIFFIGFLIGQINYNLEDNLNIETLENYHDIILVKGELSRNELTDRYIKAEKIKVEQEKYNTYLNLNTILEISELKNIKSMYIMDKKYIDNVVELIENETLIDNNIILSYPKYIIDDLADYMSYNLGTKFYSGNFPNEGKNEVMLSKDLLIKNHGYTEDNVNTAINKTISITTNNTLTDYKVVGFSRFDYYVVSFDPKFNYGLYTFDMSTYRKFGDDLLAYEVSSGNPKIGMIDDLIIVTNKGKERSVLNNVVEITPTSSFKSYEYGVTWIKDYNFEVYKENYLFVGISSILLALVIFLVNFSSTTYNLKLFKDFENFYICKNKFTKNYYLFITFIFLLLIPLSLFINGLFKMSRYSREFIFFSLIILSFSYLLNFVRFKLITNKKL